MSKKETYYCDVCEEEKEIKNLDIQVIFTTDQTEGRSKSPYLSKQIIDICDDCMSYLLQGYYLFGSGAQGYNKYWFKNVEFKNNE